MKFMQTLSRKGAVLLAAAGLILAGGLFFRMRMPATAVQTAQTDRILPIYSVERDNKTVALSFDAAWGNEDTQQLIDILTDHGVKATFFLVGQWVDRYPESVKALADAGMDVMNHSDDHAHFSQLSEQDIISNVNACNDKIEAITGTRPTLFRCPYGEYDNHVVSAVNSMGMHVIQWNVDSLDWKELSAQEITARVTKQVVPGSIILFHNAALHTPEALPGIIEYLQQEGYEILPVSQLILSGDTVIDHTGRQSKV